MTIDTLGRFFATLAVVTVPVACGSRVETTNQTPTGPNPGPTHTPCTQAMDGDPCDAAIEEACAYECSSCEAACLDGRWAISCGIVADGCPSTPPARGSSCSLLCDRECGPYTIETSCSTTELAVASCTPFGWSYDTTCQPACHDATDQASCDALTDCAWMVPCDGNLGGRCLINPPAWGSCGEVSCPPDSTCVQVTINPDEPSSGNCDHAASSVAICE